MTLNIQIGLKLSCLCLSLQWHIIEQVGDKVRFIKFDDMCDNHCIQWASIQSKNISCQWFISYSVSGYIRDCKWKIYSKN